MQEASASDSAKEGRERRQRTERLLLLEHTNDYAELDDEVEGGSDGWPDDGEHEEPDRVEVLRRVRLEVVGDGEASVGADVTSSDGEDNAKDDHGLIEMIWISYGHQEGSEKRTMEEARVPSSTT